LKFFQSKLSTNGLCIFTTHGQLPINRLQENETTYGLTENSKESLLSKFQESGYGYADYENQSGYGISVVFHDCMTKLAQSVGLWKEIAFIEHGWDNHQDVYGFVNS